MSSFAVTVKFGRSGFCILLIFFKITIKWILVQIFQKRIATTVFKSCLFHIQAEKRTVEKWKNVFDVVALSIWI
jgi:hypothetical protein